MSIVTIKADELGPGELARLRAVSEGRGGDVDSAVLRRVAAELYGGLAAGGAVAVVTRGSTVSPAGAAQILGVSRAYASVLVRTGRLPSTRTGAHHRIAVADVLAFAREREALREVRRLGAELEGEGLDGEEIGGGDGE